MISDHGRIQSLDGDGVLRRDAAGLYAEVEWQMSGRPGAGAGAGTGITSQ